MTAELYKCCFCLTTVQNPIVMCFQTHVGCFVCVCEQIRQTESREVCCALCRQPLHLRFDRLVTESAATMHRAKRRKSQAILYENFLKLLELKGKDKFRVFTRTLKRFAIATPTTESIQVLSADIYNIVEARKSVQRLLEQKLYDPKTSIRI